MFPGDEGHTRRRWLGMSALCWKRCGRRRFLAHVEISDFSLTRDTHDSTDVPLSDSIQNGTVTRLLRAKAKNLPERRLSRYARRSLRTVQEV